MFPRKQSPANAAKSPPEFAGANGIGLTQTYVEIKAGRLRAHKVGKRTIIFPEDEAAWRAALPEYRPWKPAARKPASAA